MERAWEIVHPIPQNQNSEEAKVAKNQKIASFVNGSFCVEPINTITMSMFKPAKNTTFNPQEINILNAGTRITGDLASEGDLRVDGSVQGNIEVKTKLVLGQSAHVRGNINAQNSDVSGVVIGNVTVSELLTIKATAKITGDIACSKLIIEAGAEFNGNSAMRPAVVAADFRNMSNKQQKNADSKETLVAEQA